MQWEIFLYREKISFQIPFLQIVEVSMKRVRGVGGERVKGLEIVQLHFTKGNSIKKYPCVFISFKFSITFWKFLSSFGALVTFLIFDVCKNIYFQFEYIVSFTLQIMKVKLLKGKKGNKGIKSFPQTQLSNPYFFLIF